MKAIDRNDTDLVTKIRDRFTHVTHKGVENHYRGNECEADTAWTTLRMHCTPRRTSSRWTRASSTASTRPAA